MNELSLQRDAHTDNRTLISLALVTLLIHFLGNGGYGYFRDELYYIACSKHLAWGFVDQPPFCELMLAASGHLLGYSLFALRFLPTVCGALVAYLVGQYGLPNAISSHNNYWFWEPGDKPGKVLLVIGGSKEDYENMYEDVEEVATFEHPYAKESGASIYLCRKPKHTLQEIWPHIRVFV